MSGISACEQPRWLGEQERRCRGYRAGSTPRPSKQKWRWLPSRGERTLAELAQQYDVHANQITTWKSQLFEGSAGVFGAEARPDPAAPQVDLKALHAKIGELTLTYVFLPERS